MKDLIQIRNNAISEIQPNSLGDLLKPLTKEVYLTDSHVSDILFKGEPDLSGLKKGDELLLKREKNLYDDKTVAVLKQDGLRLGELPDFSQEIFANLLDAGKALKATIKSIDITDEFQTLVISIYMIDF